MTWWLRQLNFIEAAGSTNDSGRVGAKAFGGQNVEQKCERFGRLALFDNSSRTITGGNINENIQK